MANRKTASKKEESVEESITSEEYEGDEIEYSQDQLQEAEELLGDIEEITGSEEGSASQDDAESASGSADSAEEDDEVQRTIFIKDIDYDLKEDDLKKQMQRLGEVVRVTIPLTHDGRRNKGFAYVEFKDIKAAQKGLKLDGTEVLGRKVTVSQARPRQNKRIFTIYVKNLSYNTTKEEIKEHFEKFGKVYNVTLPVDRENEERNKGFCFVEYNDEEVVKNVMKGKHELNDRKLYLNEGNKTESRNERRGSDRLYGRRNGKDEDSDEDRPSRGRFNRDDNRRNDNRRGGDNRRNDNRRGGDRGDDRRNDNRRGGDRDDNRRFNRDDNRRNNDRSFKKDHSKKPNKVVFNDADSE